MRKKTLRNKNIKLKKNCAMIRSILPWNGFLSRITSNSLRIWIIWIRFLWHSQVLWCILFISFFFTSRKCNCIVFSVSYICHLLIDMHLMCFPTFYDVHVIWDFCEQFLNFAIKMKLKWNWNKEKNAIWIELCTVGTIHQYICKSQQFYSVFFKFLNCKFDGDMSNWVFMKCIFVKFIRVYENLIYLNIF